LSGNGCIAGHYYFSSSQVQTVSVGALGTDTTFAGTIIDNAVGNPAFGNNDGAANNALALSKVGSGTLTLTGNSSYSGPTSINAGTLKLTGILGGTGTVTVASGATLAGTGTIAGSVALAAGGSIAPGNAGTGTLSVSGSLSLSDGSVLNLEVSGTANSDLVTVASGVATSGTTTLNFTSVAGFGGGSFPIIVTSGSLDPGSFAVGALPPSYSCSLSASNGVLWACLSTLPAVPTGLSAIAGDRSVSLSWNPSGLSTGYKLKRSTTSGTGYVAVASGTATSYVDNTGLTNGTTYYYVVSAVNGALDSGNSSEVSARPSGPFTWGEQSGSKIGLGPDGQGNTVASLTVPASVLGHTYQLQYSATLASGSWTNLGSPVAGTGGQIVISAITDPGARKGFFRLLITR
jgi:autotransporter-associated beta strand protein